jgi:hypothetical protein
VIAVKNTRQPWYRELWVQGLIALAALGPLLRLIGTLWLKSALFVLVVLGIVSRLPCRLKVRFLAFTIFKLPTIFTLLPYPAGTSRASWRSHVRTLSADSGGANLRVVATT